MNTLNHSIPDRLAAGIAIVYVNGGYLKCSWGGEIQNISILVAIGLNQSGYLEITGAAEVMKEGRESWKNFFV